MPDLNLGPAPTQSPLKAILISFGALALIAAAIFYLNPHKTADVAILGTQIYAPHTQMKAMPGTIHVIGTVGEAEDDLYVSVRLSITDRLRLPLFVKEATAVLTAPDATVADADIILPADMPAVATVFPQLAPLTASPLARDAQISPGATTTGTILLHFPHMTADNWSQRKQATLTLNFFHQSPLTTTIP